MHIEERTEKQIIFAANVPDIHGQAYIGCILSEDRSIVYWVNDTKPLP